MNNYVLLDGSQIKIEVMLKKNNWQILQLAVYFTVSREVLGDKETLNWSFDIDKVVALRETPDNSDDWQEYEYNLYDTFLSGAEKINVNIEVETWMIDYKMEGN